MSVACSCLSLAVALLVPRPLLLAQGANSSPTATDVSGMRMSPSGEHVVYAVDPELDSSYELFTLRLEPGSTPVSLGTGTGWWTPTPDGRVIFRPGTGYSIVPIDGSAPPVVLTGGAGIHERLSSDGRWLVYTGTTGNAVVRATTDGSHPWEVLATGTEIASEVIDPTNQYVVFGDTNGLHSARLDGSQPPTSLGTGVVGNPELHWVTPPFFPTIDHQGNVFYLADQDQPGVVELYTVPIDGSSPPTKLSPGLVGGDVWSFRLAGDRVVFLFAENPSYFSTWNYELFSVPIDGSSPPTSFFPPGEGNGFGAWTVSPDQQRVVFGAPFPTEVHRLAMSPIDASTEPSFLEDLPPGPYRYISAVHYTPDEQRIVYSGGPHVWSVRADGSAPPEILNPTPHDSYILRMHVDEQGRYVSYQVGTRQVYLAPPDGSSGPVPLHPNPSPGSQIWRWDTTPDGGTFVYLLKPQPGPPPYDLYVRRFPAQARPSPPPNGSHDLTVERDGD